MYNNYKLKALLADKTSDYVVISVIQGCRQKKIMAEARSTKKLRLRQCQGDQGVYDDCRKKEFKSFSFKQLFES